MKTSKQMKNMYKKIFSKKLNCIENAYASNYNEVSKSPEKFIENLKNWFK